MFTTRSNGLPNLEEIGQHQQLLRLLVALVAEAQRNQLLVTKERILFQVRKQTFRADRTEPESDGPAEHADDELVGVPANG
jgi:hypothetical protein